MCDLVSWDGDDPRRGRMCDFHTIGQTFAQEGATFNQSPRQTGAILAAGKL